MQINNTPEGIIYIEYENTIIGICFPPEVLKPLKTIMRIVITDAPKNHISIACTGVLIFKRLPIFENSPNSNYLFSTINYLVRSLHLPPYNYLMEDF